MPLSALDDLPLFADDDPSDQDLLRLRGRDRTRAILHRSTPTREAERADVREVADRLGVTPYDAVFLRVLRQGRFRWLYGNAAGWLLGDRHPRTNDLLDELIPGWAQARPAEFDDAVGVPPERNRLITRASVTAASKLPTADRVLWAKQVRYRRLNRLTPEQLSLLDELMPDWRTIGGPLSLDPAIREAREQERAQRAIERAAAQEARRDRERVAAVAVARSRAERIAWASAIQAAARASGVSDRELARRVGRYLSSVQSFFHPGRVPQDQTIDRFARALGVTNRRDITPEAFLTLFTARMDAHRIAA